MNKLVSMGKKHINSQEINTNKIAQFLNHLSFQKKYITSVALINSTTV